ncbi:MAG: HAMP domain-containing protein, partial [Arcobacteraceae bacterium]|nr:HAMP domain-containing protein [Arcobacteraceae bacterium]
MNQKTTYKKLILKSIIVTLLITLAIAFIYAHVMKKEAIETLTKVDAKKTTQLVFETLYSAMSKGWDKQDLENIIKRVNNIDKEMIVNVYRSQEVAKQYGEIQKDLEARTKNPFVGRAFAHEEIFNLIDESTIEYFYPVVAKQECMACHTTAQVGNVLGVIEISYPIVDLKVSLSSLINFFVVFVIAFSGIVFIALFIKLDKHLVKPIKNFVQNVNQISNNKDITQRVNVENEIHEIHSMQEVFNNMLDSLEFQFYNDELTGLPNRKRLLETISNKSNAILMILNIDKFQEINDL